jgi:hypothetical protein
MVRFLSGCLMFVAAFASTPATAPQDSLDLRARYGEPDVERFAVRPDVTVTVEYGSDGKTSLLLIESRHAFLHSFLEQQPSMPKETARDVLNEVLPETRGKELRSTGSFQSSCLSVAGVSVEGLSITEASNCAGLMHLAVRPQSTPLPLTSAELHARYGKPDVERFTVRPDLTLTTEYGLDGPACAMRVEQHHSLVHVPISEPPAPVGKMAEVLNEVVPLEERGKEISAKAAGSASCPGWHAPTEYENVIVDVNYMACNQATILSMELRFKRPACDSLQPRRIPELR